MTSISKIILLLHCIALNIFHPIHPRDPVATDTRLIHPFLPFFLVMHYFISARHATRPLFTLSTR